MSDFFAFVLSCVSIYFVTGRTSSKESHQMPIKQDSETRETGVLKPQWSVVLYKERSVGMLEKSGHNVIS
jgi:hypothetical protein